MGRRLQAIGILLIGVLTASAAWAVGPVDTTASTMCPPVTMDDLLEDEETTTTTTSTPPSSTSTTTPPSSTTSTTAPAATTTVPDTTVPDTTVPDTSTTTVPGTTTPTTTPTTTSSTTPTTVAPDPTTTTAPTTTAPTTTVPPTTTTTVPPCDEDFVYPLVFPILGTGGIGSPFGAPRDGGKRLHAGNDLFAPHLQPIIAAADGVVSRIGGDEGISGNRIYIRHADGWSTLYIHLNNDTAGTDDGNGRGVRIDLEQGDEVVAGQVIGWTGDSGNAEGTVHHLHFELRDPDGNPVDPEASLRAAERVTVPDGAEEFIGPFADHPGESDGIDPMQLLLSRGAPVWCDDQGALACPDGDADAASVAAWLQPLIGEVSLEPAPAERPAPVLDCSGARSCLQELVAECAGDCESPVITRAELMRAFVWDRLRDAHQSHTFGMGESIPDSAWATPAPAPPDHPYDLAIGDVKERLGRGLACLGTDGIDQPLTRVEAAQWIVAYLGWTDVCSSPVSTAAFATR